MATKKIDANLSGTIQDSFAIAGVSISTDADAVKIPSNRFFYDGLGALGEMYANGVESSGSFTFNFAAHGTRQSVVFDTNTTYYIASGNMPKNGLHMMAITNTSGADLTPVWNSRYDFGAAGPPTIPDGETCLVVGLWDSVNVIMRCTHNCAAGSASPAFIDTGILVTGGGLLGAPLDPSLTSAQIRGMSTGTYDYSTADDWQLWVSPTPVSGSFVLDVRVRSFGNTLPSSGDSVCASAKPTLTGNGTDFTASGATATWTGSLARGDMITVVPTTNSAAVKWWSLYIPARRTL